MWLLVHCSTQGAAMDVVEGWSNDLLINNINKKSCGCHTAVAMHASMGAASTVRDIDSQN